uniref:HUN domain-containing protein n=1 Tax=Parastrongyloides trichosuri TaxID=131310 RepID=A0A0N4ZFX1_PARTI
MDVKVSMCVVRNRKPNANSANKDTAATSSSVLHTTKSSKNNAPTAKTYQTPFAIFRGNPKQSKIQACNNNTNNVKTSTPINNMELSNRENTKINTSYHAKKIQNFETPKEEITQVADSCHFDLSLRKQDHGDKDNFYRLDSLDCTQATDKFDLLNEYSSSAKKNNNQGEVDEENEEQHEMVMDATVLNEDDTLYGIEKVMPEYHL